MSRCGSCPIYDQEHYGCYCEGNQGVEECAENLQGLYHSMEVYIRILTTPSGKKAQKVEARQAGVK